MTLLNRIAASFLIRILPEAKKPADKILHQSASPILSNANIFSNEVPLAHNRKIDKLEI